MVSQGYLPGPNGAAAAYEARQRGAVVRAAEGPRPADEPVDGLAGHRVHHGRFQHLVGSQRRQNRGHARGQHGLAGAGRPHHEQAVIARGRYLEGPLGHIVAGHFPVVRLGAGHCAAAGPMPFEHRRRAPFPERLAQAPHGENAHVVQGHRVAVGSAHEVQPERPGANGAGQRPRHRPHPPVKGQLAHVQGPFGPGRIDLLGRRQNAQGHGQVEPGSRLAQAARRQVHHDLLAGHGEARGPNGRPHPLPGLLDSRIRHAHDGHAGQAGRHHHLHRHGNHLHPAHGGARHGALSHRHDYTTGKAPRWWRTRARSSDTATMAMTSKRTTTSPMQWPCT